MMIRPLDPNSASVRISFSIAGRTECGATTRRLYSNVRAYPVR